MANFNEQAIREAAYYIWKNGDKKYDCGMDNWNAAISQLRAQNAAAVLKCGQQMGTGKTTAAALYRGINLIKKGNMR